MRDHDISGIPVLNEQGAVPGVISEKDFLSRMTEKKAPSFMQVLIQCMDDSRCLAPAPKSTEGPGHHVFSAGDCPQKSQVAGRSQPYGSEKY
ncbi:CBS domain-containing protein [uncultured Desulfobacter sp.]|uniref:CBS domain-containing protein n=1 Tax=uncultured Desulfobacter sp. TaxID=240139 RepID=UPI002AA74C9B|nr:CBS domain-containing protein [uncultured Desulfobacter sp.]